MYDTKEKELALQLQARNAGWLVFYGCYWRDFTAWACWIREECPYVRADSIQELERQMRELELRHPRSPRWKAADHPRM